MTSHSLLLDDTTIYMRDRIDHSKHDVTCLLSKEGERWIWHKKTWACQFETYFKTI